MIVRHLLREADALQRVSEAALRTTTLDQLRADLHTLADRYHDWCARCRAVLPDDLADQFAQGAAPGAPNRPTAYDFFAAAQPVMDATAQAASIAPQLWSVWFTGFRPALQEQRDGVFFARRRIWTGVSQLPTGVAQGLATRCKRAYQRYGIDDLFIRSGGEPHWPIPPVAPHPDSVRMNVVFGWLDGILVSAPDQEVTIVQTVCATIRSKPRLSHPQRLQLSGWLLQIQQRNATPPSPLDRYAVHPRVRHVAGPLIANGHFGEAILKVAIALHEAVQQAAGRPDLDGSRRMQQVFAPHAPILRAASDSTEQQGWMFLFTGLIQALRNPRAHRLIDDTDEAEAIEWLLFASALFRVLERSTPPSRP